MIATVLDTEPIVAALNSRDRRHIECAELLVSLEGRRLLPSPVLTEVCWLLERWPHVEAAFLAHVANGAFELVHLTSADLTRMGELILQYADFPLGGLMPRCWLSPSASTPTEWRPLTAATSAFSSRPMSQL